MQKSRVQMTALKMLQAKPARLSISVVKKCVSDCCSSTPTQDNQQATILLHSEDGRAGGRAADGPGGLAQGDGALGPQPPLFGRSGQKREAGRGSK